MTERDDNSDQNYDPYVYGMVNLGPGATPQDASEDAPPAAAPDAEDILFGEGESAADPDNVVSLSLPGLDLEDQAAHVEEDHGAPALGEDASLVDLAPRAREAERLEADDDDGEDDDLDFVLPDAGRSEVEADEGEPDTPTIDTVEVEEVELDDDDQELLDADPIEEVGARRTRMAPRTEMVLADDGVVTRERRRRLSGGASISSLQVKVSRQVRPKSSGVASWIVPTAILATGVGAGLALFLIAQSAILGGLVLGLGVVGAMFCAVLMR